MRAALLGSLLGLLAIGATPAFAATAYVGQTMTIHAGPGTNYPGLERLSPQTRLWLHGCQQDLAWCDVSHGRLRGWVQASGLTIPHGGRAEEGIPRASFDLEAYWAQNYAREAFYADRARWANISRQVAESPNAR